MTTMSHYSRVLKIVIDAPPELHDQELAFWEGAVGQELPEVYSPSITAPSFAGAT